MSVYSMTGYAIGHAREPSPGSMATSPAPMGLEIRSVNSRFLDLSFRLSEELRATEPALRELVGAHIKRGKVEVRAWLDSAATSGWQPPALADLQKIVQLQDHVLGWLPQARPLAVTEVLHLCKPSGPASGDLAPALLALAQTTVQDFVEARQREGQRLATVLLGHLAQLRQLAEQAQPLVPQVVEAQRQRFLTRWQEALGATQTEASSSAAQDRALTEATAYALRIDVAEELARLQSHFAEIERLLLHGGEVGKRLDFFIQELHREANTLGSKSTGIELTRIAVDMKVLIEQMREQVQNLE